MVTALGGNGQDDDAAIMPLGTARAYLLGGADTLSQIIVRADSPAAVPAAHDELTKILDRRHHIRGAAKRDFTITALGALLDKANQFLVAIHLG